jgi:Putative Actinobacterial Holin-X, holin superfamily III
MYQRVRDEMEMESSRQSRSVGSLFGALGRQLSALFRRELALARAELSEKVREAGSGLALLAAGGMIILIGLFFIVQAVVFGVVALLDIWLPAGVAVWLGPLLVGLATVLIGWALLSRGGNKLSAETLALHRTAQSLREDSALAREHLP